MGMYELKHPNLLFVEDESGARTVGGDQEWYPRAGYLPGGACGATTASNQLAYILRSHPDLFDRARGAGLDGLAGPLTDDANSKPGYLEFMKKIYAFFHPRAGGLMVDAFVEGVSALSDEYGLPLKAESLPVTIMRSKRPSKDAVSLFIRESLASDIPVAFLILSAGCEKALENWHWVTIMAYDGEGESARIIDNGNVIHADIGAWLDSSIMGGSFVRLLI